MKKVTLIKGAVAVGLLMVTALGCKSPLENERLNELNFETGGYMRIVTPFPSGRDAFGEPLTLNNIFNVSLVDMAGTKLELVHEAVTPDKGAQFASYDMVLRFVDRTPDNGTNNVGDKPFRSLAASTFTKDTQTNYPRATMIITGQEALTVSGLSLDKLTAPVRGSDGKITKLGDYFEVRGTMKLTDGRLFLASNTGANITGGAFYSSPFIYRINVVE